MPYYRLCPVCGAALDPGEICTDCSKPRKENDRCQPLEICQDASSAGLKLSERQTDRPAARLDGSADVVVEKK